VFLLRMVEITILAHYEALFRKRGWVHPHHFQSLSLSRRHQAICQMESSNPI
jgi:hypothetical protein